MFCPSERQSASSPALFSPDPAKLLLTPQSGPPLCSWGVGGAQLPPSRFFLLPRIPGRAIWEGLCGHHVPTQAGRCPGGTPKKILTVSLKRAPLRYTREPGNATPSSTHSDRDRNLRTGFIQRPLNSLEPKNTLVRIWAEQCKGHGPHLPV